MPEAVAPHPFRFGVHCWTASSAADWRGKARRAEDLGYASFLVTDHVLGPGPALDASGHPAQDLAAVPAVAVAAEATTRTRPRCGMAPRRGSRRVLRLAGREAEIVIEIGIYAMLVTRDATEATAALSAATGLGPEDVAFHPHVLVGSHSSIAEELQRRRAEYGISYVTVFESDAAAFAPVVELRTGT